MKTLIHLLTAAGTLALLHAQGPLTPSAAPAPTMKTLTQVEPRTPVQSLALAPPYTISQPGSYYLTDNITVTGGSAINITASDVTLDLMGFTIESTATTANGTAVSVGTVARLKVCNGNIQSGSTVTAGVMAPKGFDSGIFGVFITNSTISDLQIVGVSDYGIYLDQDGVVERCKVTNSSFGILNFASGDNNTVTKDCNVTNCVEYGITGGLVEGCNGYGFSSHGISGKVISNSRGSSQTGTGLIVTECAQNCSGSSGVGTGLEGAGATVTGCLATTVNGTYSLRAKIAIGCVVSTVSGPTSGGITDITNRYNMP